ncbi:MAG: hypothetical protein ACXIU7_10775 [Roseinatronobacter sp.]
MQILLRGIVEHGNGEAPVLARCLVLQGLQPLRLADGHSATPDLPLFGRRMTDTELAPQSGDRKAGLMVLNNADDLAFGEPAVRHAWSLQLGRLYLKLDQVEGAISLFSRATADIAKGDARRDISRAGRATVVLRLNR